MGLGFAFLRHLERSRALVYVIDMAGTDARKPWDDYRVLSEEVRAYSMELAERPSIVVANKMDVAAARRNFARFVKETGVEPIAISCAEGFAGAKATKTFPGMPDNGIEKFRAALRKTIAPVVAAAKPAEKPPLHEMPDTTGEEIPAEALKFATFLKLDPPKKKSHPSRGNIH